MNLPRYPNQADPLVGPFKVSGQELFMTETGAAKELFESQTDWTQQILAYKKQNQVPLAGLLNMIN